MSARPWWREPLVHAVVLGAAIFGLHRWKSPRVDPREIIVSASFVAGLRESYARSNGHPPSERELRDEVDRFVREEVLYREALALGLDRGDLIVRRRLAQKMEFLVQDTAAPPEPTRAELERYLDAHRERYAQPPRVSFRQVFLDRGRRAATLDADAAALLARARAGEDASALGDPFITGGEVTGLTPAAASANFGDELARAVFAAPENTWSGPFPSRYGLHLVYVTSRSPGTPATLDAVRETLVRDYAEDRRIAANHAAIQRLVEGYHVRTEAAP